MKKFFLYFIGIAFTFCVSLMLYLANFADDDLANFPELEPSLTEVPAKDNGFAALVAAVQVLELTKEYEDAVDPSLPLAERVIHFEALYKANKSTFQEFDEALNKPYIQEKIQTDWSQEFEGLNLVYLARILSIQRHYHQTQGDTEAAAQTLEQLNKLSTKYLWSDGILVKHLLAKAITNQLFTEWMHSFTSQELTADQLGSEKELVSLLTEDYQKAIQLEWKTSSSRSQSLSEISGMLTAFSASPITQAFLYQPNKTLNTYGQLLQYNLQLSQATRSEKKAIQKQIAALTPVTGKLKLSSNYVGNELLEMTFASQKSISPGFEQLLLKHRALRLLIALRAYADDHSNQLPNTLNELVPQYIAALPLDPYSDKPLLYSKTNKTFWSVGEDMEDNHGTSIESARPNEINPLATLDCEDEPHLVIPF